MNLEDLEVELLKEIEAVDALLNRDGEAWKQIRGSLNILKSSNRQHYSKIKRKLFMDFRMVADHQISDSDLGSHMDRAYEIAELFEIGKI